MRGDSDSPLDEQKLLKKTLKNMVHLKHNLYQAQTFNFQIKNIFSKYKKFLLVWPEM